MYFYYFNWVGVGAAFVVAMVVGMLWYSPVLFGNLWMKLNKFTKADEKRMRKEMGKVMAVTALMSLVQAVVFSMFVSHVGVAWAVKTMVVLWGGVVMPVQLSDVLYEKRPMGLFWIHTGYRLVSMVLMGLAIVGTEMFMSPDVLDY